jgi:hypothetical protein
MKNKTLAKLIQLIVCNVIYRIVKKKKISNSSVGKKIPTHPPDHSY